jgi:iron complex outermembrane receptor protein
VGEVIVTARKRVERLRDVPAAAVAISAQELDQRPLALTMEDIIDFVPGARFNNLGTSDLSELSFRSAGTAQNTSADTPVGLFANGVYIQGGPQFGRNFSQIDLFDLSGVQIFLGTQGGLLGRNSVGGVVSLTDAQPQFDRTGGFAVADYGPKVQGGGVQAVENWVINDHWAVRAGIEVLDQNKGNFYNADNNTYFDADHGWLGRVQVRYQNGPFDATLLYQDQEYNPPTTNFAIYVPAGTAGYPVGYTGNPYTYYQNAGEYGEQDIHQVQFNASYDFGWAQLVSDSSFRQRYSHFFGDADGLDPQEQSAIVAEGNPGAAALNVYQFQNLVDLTDIYYEDLHLLGKKIGPFSWLAGAELLHTESHYETNYGLTGGTATALVPSVTDYKLMYTSQAYYAQAQWDIFPKLNASVDGRYSVDDKHFSLESFTGPATIYPAALSPATVVAVPYTDERYFGTNFSYTATLTYKFLPEWMAYAKVGTAYRPGGFNTVINPPAPNVPPLSVQPTYNAETTQSYEIGTKGNILSNLFVTLDGYRNVTNNSLEQVNDGCGPTVPQCTAKAVNFVTNAGQSRPWGIEATANLNYTFLGGQGTAMVSGSREGAKYYDSAYAGLMVPQSPAWIGSFDLVYQHAIVNDVIGFMDWTYRLQRGGTTNITPQPIIPLDNLDLVDLKAGVKKGNIQVSLFITNLTNENYYVYKASSYYTEGEPFQWGLELRYKW